MIVQFNSEFARIAAILNAGYSNKSISELQDYVQGYNFEQPLINWQPITTITPRVGHSGQIMYNGDCVLHFLTKASKSNNFENTKDVLIDQMIILHEFFIHNLNNNDNLVFINPRWEMKFNILRQFTSNFLCGIECSITFDTACNRIS